jgi:ankyrin repeat protein
MSFKTSISSKKILNFCLLIYFLVISYLIFYKKIENIFSTIFFIVLGTILVIINLKVNTNPLFDTMKTDNLTKFKEYLASQNLKVSNIHKIEYIAGKTPIIMAMERDAYNIFKFLVENNYDLKYVSERSEPAITFAAHSADLKYMELLLKNKNKLFLNAINNKFGANALEMAIWRGKEDIVEALINAGMTFSIQKYNNTKIGKFITPFENIPLKIKTILVKRFVFNKTIKQINMVDEIIDNEDIKSFKDTKVYWKGYLQFA